MRIGVATAALTAAVLLPLASGAARYRIDTFAGGGGPEDDPGDGLPATLAVLNHPTGLARDAAGRIYIADHDHARIRRVQTRRGVRFIMTVAGTGVRGWSGDGGPATAAQLVQPTGVSVLPNGDLLVADAGDDARGNAVRRIDRAGIIHLFAGVPGQSPGNTGTGGDAAAAQLHTPLRTAVTRTGDVYVVELNNHQVRLVRGANGIIESFAGTGEAGDDGDEGPAVAAHLQNPAGIALGARGLVYIADFGNQRLRVVTADGIIHALGGTGVQTGSIDGEGGDPRDDLGDGGPVGQATFWKPTGIALEARGALLVADQGNNRIRRIERDASGGLSPASTITTIIGTGAPGFVGDGGDASLAALLIPTEVLPIGRGRLLIADRGNQRVRIAVPVRHLCARRCSDGNPCTADRCDRRLGCVHEPLPGDAAARCLAAVGRRLSAR